MSDSAPRVVQKLWPYCHILRDDGSSYQDHLEQLSFLLFLNGSDGTRDTEPPMTAPCLRRVRRLLRVRHVTPNRSGAT